MAVVKLDVYIYIYIKGAKINSAEKIMNTIYDLCFVLDRRAFDLFISFAN